ncbi:hypothetical protein M9H77_00534 [Catharanthus roseus]|nr:hypothetical protein M9H77_00534 [Catharanthus roseus]
MGLKPLHAHPLGKVNIKPILLRQQTQDGQLNQSGLSGPRPPLEFHFRKPSSPPPCQESQLCKGCPCFIWAFLRRVKAGRGAILRKSNLLSVSGQGGHGMGAGPWLIGSDFNVLIYLVSEVRLVESVLSDHSPRLEKFRYRRSLNRTFPTGPVL